MLKNQGVWKPGGRQDPAGTAAGPAVGWPIWILSWDAKTGRYGCVMGSIVAYDDLDAWDPWLTVDFWCYSAGPERPMLPPGPPPLGTAK